MTTPAGMAAKRAAARRAPAAKAKSRTTVPRKPPQPRTYGQVRKVARAKLPAGYNGVILGEFLTCVAVAAFAPITRPAAAQTTSGPSPYEPADLARLMAIGVVFFVLALLGHGRPGKLAAGFGGLVTLGVVFSAVRSGAVAGLGPVFGQNVDAKNPAVTGAAAGAVPATAGMTVGQGVTEGGQILAGGGG